MKKTWLFLTIFGVFWSTITLIFDGWLGYSLINQLRARSFARVTGYITHSEITTHHSDDGVTHGVDIRYHYEVNGQSFEGNRFRYGEGSSSDSGWARRAAGIYQVGAEVPVYYNKSNPSESVLSPGVDGSNLMMVLFMTPFNSVMFIFWLGGMGMLRAKFSQSPNGGFKYSEEGQILRVRLPRFPASIIFLVTTGFVGFASIFPVAIRGGGFHPSIPTVSTGLIIVFSSGLLMFLRQYWVNHSESSYLVIDNARQMVELPRTFGRKTKLQIPLSDIVDLQVDIAINPGEDGSTFPYNPTLSWKNSEFGQGKLAELYTHSSAWQFVDWLSPRLRIGGTAPKSTPWKSAMPVPKSNVDKA